MKQTFKSLIVAAVAALFSLTATAQVTTSSIGGVITDAYGPVVGAVVIATYTPTGAQYHAVTDEDGIYRIISIVPGGPYTVSVEMLGYATATTEGISVALADNYLHDVTLQEETLTLKQVVVIADGSTSSMRSDRAGAVTSLTSSQMSKIPTVSRSMNDIMKFSPQAASTSNGMAIGGGNYRQSFVTVDGASFNNTFGIGGNLPAGGSPISMDALDQMAISITPYDVRQSGFTGGAIQTTTKSGTNEFHVSVYDYFKNEKLKGTKYGTEGKQLSLSKQLNNTVGFNFSGPIVKNKLFFFINFEFESDVVPGNTRLARKDATGEWGGSTQYNRPTVAFMDEVKSYLSSKYNYDPGRYADYSASTPDWKLFVRLDWLINENHKLTARFSKTMNKYSSSPSSSVSGLTTVSGYSNTRNNSGRVSNNALYFESNRYFQEQNYTSFAAELNSRFFGGRGNNILRVTYSKQYEPRSYVGNLFPTVDIFDSTGLEGTKLTDQEKTNAVITSFGLDPFTYGNLRDASNVVATDEFTFNAGIHTLLGGLSYEFNKAINGYMQGGAGYYSFNSWEDFKNEKPSAFSIMYGNNANLDQAYPTIKYHQAALYLQDEMAFSNRFKLTAGVRFELPIYPNMTWNENKDFTTKWADNGGYKTSDTPKAALSVSPRIGFNWDVTSNRTVVIRGGTGIFTGRLPMVWLVSAVGNSNVLQNNWGTTDAATIAKIGFHTNPTEIIDALKKAGIPNLVGDLKAPSGATVLDKNLKMPQTWKSSLAVDVQIPGGVKATVEGIYNKDLRTVYVNNRAKVENGTVQLPGEPKARTNWKASGIVSNMYHLTNTDVNGYYYSVSATLSKDFNFGLSLSASYAHSNSMGVNDGIGDQVSSAWNTNTYSVDGSNKPELGYGTYVAPHRVIGNISYRIDEGMGFATTIGLFYEGYNFGYANGTSYSYTRYNYLMGSDVTNCGGSVSLMYIPTDAQLDQMVFADPSNKAAFKDFLATDKYLSKHRGEYSVRGAGIMPWHNAINFKVSQDLAVRIGERYHALELGVDFNNIANLFSPKWGNVKYLATEKFLSYNAKTQTYSFTAPTWNTVAGTASTWSALLSIRYKF
ncbi:MAG: TonB-dependent receptor [Bacteroidales bacterium]|nr:TonB-dependent receptor [Bacteroidales bacterium]